MRTRSANKRSSVRTVSPGSDESPEKIRRVSRRQKGKGEMTRLIKNDKSSLCSTAPASNESLDKVERVSPRQKGRGREAKSIKNDSVSSSDRGYGGSSCEDGTDRHSREGTNSGLPSAKKSEDASDDSSDSSSDDFLVPTQSLDLDSAFFKIEKREPVSDFSAVESSIYAGINRLSESDDSDDLQDSKPAKIERVAEKPGLQEGEQVVRFEHCSAGLVTIKVEDDNDFKPRTFRKGRKTRNAKQQNSYDMDSKQEGTQQDKAMVKSNVTKAEKEGRVHIDKKQESDRKQLCKVESATTDVSKLDVSQLLALGEGLDTKPKPVSKRKRRNISKKYVDSEEGNSDWEEVNTSILERQQIEHFIPKEGIAVTVQVPSIHQKKIKKKRFDLAAYIKRKMKRVRQDIQVLMHKAHLLCWISHGNYVNKILNSEILMGLSLSLIPSELFYPDKHTDFAYLQQIVQWFSKTVEVRENVDDDDDDDDEELLISLQNQFEKTTAKSRRDIVLMFVCVLRSLGINTRLVISLQPLPLKLPVSEISNITSKKPSTSKRKKENEGQQKATHSRRRKNAPNTSDGAIQKNRKRTKTESERHVEVAATKKAAQSKKSNQKTTNENLAATKKSIKSESVTGSVRSLRARKSVRKYVDDSGTTDSDEETVHCEQESAKKSEIVNTKSATFKKKISVNADDIVKGKKRDRGSRIAHFSGSDSDYADFSGSDSDYAAEFQVKNNRKGKTDRRVFSSGSVSGVSPMADTKKKKKKDRCDVWSEVFLESEEKWISVDVYNQKIDCVPEISSCASQPVHYVLAWQDDSTIRDVTRRYCPKWHNVTRKLRVDEEWWRESLKPFTGQRTARDDKEDEDLDHQFQDQPLPTSLAEYKNHPLYVLKKDLLKYQAIYPPDAPTFGFVRGHPVYARECVHTLQGREKWLREAKVVRLGETPYKIVTTPRWDRVNRKILKGVPLELFGSWQVEDYVPPNAIDGKVPRNEYGNVELFKPSMLPGGTVHMQIPGLNCIARKLQIDCAPAITGFDFQRGFCHPIYDGFVICEEYKYVLAEAWQAEEEEAKRRHEKKRLKRIYGNWRRLIKGLFIRERLKARYDFGPIKERPKTKKGKRYKEPKSKKTIDYDYSDWEMGQCD